MAADRSPAFARAPLIALLLLLSVGAIAGAQPAQEGRKPASNSPHPLPYFKKIGPLGAATPRGLAEKFLRGFVEGDRSQVVSSFQLNTLESIAAATLYAETSKKIANARRLERQVRMKFGQDGLRTLQEHSVVDLEDAGRPGKVELEKVLSNLQIKVNENGSAASFPVPWKKGASFRTERAGERWYMHSPGQVGGLTLLQAIFGRQSARKTILAIEALRQSEDIEQFEEKLKALEPEYEEDEVMLVLKPGPDVQKPLCEGVELVIARKFGDEVETQVERFPPRRKELLTEDFKIYWTFMGRSSAGDVYVVRIVSGLLEREQTVRAVLYQGGKKLVYKNDSGSRIFLRPAGENASAEKSKDASAIEVKNY